MRRSIAIALTTLAAATGLTFVATSAGADTCKSTWTIGVGGFGNSDSSAFPTVDQRVGYSAGLSAQDVRNGVNELNRLVRNHRAQCQRDHIKMIGHSEGAAVVHVWVTENGRGFGNINAILLADPKRPAGPGGAGFARDLGFAGAPIAGTDNFYNGVPVLQVCFHDDHVCDADVGWDGYLFRNSHVAPYDFDVWHYGNWENGVRYW